MKVQGNEGNNVNGVSDDWSYEYEYDNEYEEEKLPEQIPAVNELPTHVVADVPESAFVEIPVEPT